jgi:lysophospholipase L1-like esterase
MSADHTHSGTLPRMAQCNNYWVRAGTAAVLAAIMLVGFGLYIALTRDDTPTPPLRAIFLGDSYTAGSAMDSGKQWPDYLAEHRGWDATDLGVGGSGYAIEGADGTRYVDRIAPSVIRSADLVVISGGLNDISKSTPDAIAPAVVETLQRVDQAAAADATIVVLSPFIVHKSETAQDMDTALAAAAANIDAEYLHVSEFLDGHPEYVGSDGTHPTDEGHRALAAFIEPMLPNNL